MERIEISPGVFAVWNEFDQLYWLETNGHNFAARLDLEGGDFYKVRLTSDNEPIAKFIPDIIKVRLLNFGTGTDGGENAL